MVFKNVVVSAIYASFFEGLEFLRQGFGTHCCRRFYHAAHIEPVVVPIAHFKGGLDILDDIRSGEFLQ